MLYLRTLVGSHETTTIRVFAVARPLSVCLVIVEQITAWRCRYTRFAKYLLIRSVAAYNIEPSQTISECGIVCGDNCVRLGWPSSGVREILL